MKTASSLCLGIATKSGALVRGVTPPRLARLSSAMSWWVTHATAICKTSYRAELHRFLYGVLTAHMAAPGSTLIESHLPFTKAAQVQPAYHP